MNNSLFLVTLAWMWVVWVNQGQLYEGWKVFCAPKQAVGCWGHLSTSLGALRLSSLQTQG